MSDLVRRLRALQHFDVCYPVPHPTCEEAADRIEQLEAENASLATWQCEFTDGKTGLVYGQGGTTFCIMAKRMQQLETEAKTRTLDYLGQVGQLSEELERLRAALRLAADALADIGVDDVLIAIDAALGEEHT